MNQDKYNALGALGYTGALNDRLRAFYLASGVVPRSLQDMEKDFLISKGVPSSAIQDMWRVYLENNSYPWTSLDIQAIDVIRRLGGTALFIPEDYGWVYGPEKITTVNTIGGTLDNISFEEDSANTYHGVSFVNSTTLQAQFKFRAKAGTKSWVWARFEGYVSGNAWFDLSTGTVGTVESGVVAKMTAAGDGYYDCTLTNKNIAAAGNCTLIAVTANTSTATYTGTGSVAFQLASYSVKEITSAAVFVNSNGTPPVTAIGDPVGLLTDRSYGAGNLGAELIPVTYVGTVSGAWTISASSITRNGSSGGQASLNPLASALDTAKRYSVRFTVSGMSGDTFGIRLGSGTAYQVTTNGVYTAVLPAGATSASLLFVPWSGTAGEATITLVSVREVLGNHATQPTTASKPVVAVNAQGKKVISFDGSNDFLQTGITTGNEGWICAGVTPGANATGHHIFGNGATLTTDVGVWFRIPSANNSATMLVSNGTTRELVTATTAAFTGTPVVVAGGWTASTLMAAVNGAESSIAKTVNCTTTKTCPLGGSTVGWYLNGPMTAIIYTPVLPNALDRALIRKWVGSLQGQTL